MKPSQEPSLNDVLITHELSQRPMNPGNESILNKALVRLALQMGAKPASLFQELAETALRLCGGNSAGVSLLENGADGEIFRWRAMTGVLAPYLNGAMPRHSPCGETIDRNEVQLFSYPERYFNYDGGVPAPIVEALLAPFRACAHAIGTVWVVAHDDSVRYTATESHILKELTQFATTAYRELVSLGYINPGRTPA